MVFLVCRDMECWESVLSLGCPGVLGTSSLGMGSLDDSGSNSEPGHGAEGPWKVLSLSSTLITPQRPSEEKTIMPLHRWGNEHSQWSAREWQRTQSTDPKPGLSHSPGSWALEGWYCLEDGTQVTNSEGPRQWKKERERKSSSNLSFLLSSCVILHNSSGLRLFSLLNYRIRLFPMGMSIWRDDFTFKLSPKPHLSRILFESLNHY